MDSLHTGFNELIYIETDKIRLTIKGNLPNFLKDRSEVSNVRVFCTDTPDEVVIHGIEQNPQSSFFHCMPLFYEQNRYELLIESKNDYEVSFWHINPGIRNQISPVGHHKDMLSGVINFDNDIGYSDFIIELNGREYLTLTIEVFPEKISYKKDYQAIMSDVTRELYNLVFDFLKKTYTGYQQSDRKKSSPVEFFAVITKIYGDYLRAVDKIIREPHHILCSDHEIMPGYKASRFDHTTVRWLRKHPEHVSREGSRWKVDRLSAVKKFVSYDTRENRITHFMIHSTIQKLQLFRRRFLLLSGRNDSEVILNVIDKMIGQLNHRVNESFLSSIDRTGGQIGLSLVFTMAPGYRELYRCYLMLERGLDITGDVFRMSVKNLAVLYEYWCFIKLNSLLKNRYSLVSQDIIRTEGNKLFVTLVKGDQSRVRYRNPVNGEYIVLSYNPDSSGLPTVPQRPDNVLTLTKNGMEGEAYTYKYIFDAKYKIDPALKDSRYYRFVSHHPGPKEEDINTMHRYRDAIVCATDHDFYERTMFGAYVLFPYDNEEEYKEHKFYKSIDEVNIGGLPFLPSATHMVENMLDELIADSPESAFERSLLPVGIEKKLAKVDWSKRDVLVGALKNREQLEFCQKYGFYHIPARQIPDDHLPVHYVAIYQSRRLFGQNSGIFLYGEVIKTSLIKRREIKEIPKDSDELYYRFDIKHWHLLKQPIHVRESAGVTLFTNRFLLLHSTEIPDLKIRSEEEFRLYYELRRMTNQDIYHDPENPLCFKYKGFLMDYEDKCIRIIKENRIVRIIPGHIFIKHPYEYFKEIQSITK